MLRFGYCKYGVLPVRTLPTPYSNPIGSRLQYPVRGKTSAMNAATTGYSNSTLCANLVVIESHCMATFDARPSHTRPGALGILGSVAFITYDLRTLIGDQRIPRLLVGSK